MSKINEISDLFDDSLFESLREQVEKASPPRKPIKGSKEKISPKQIRQRNANSSESSDIDESIRIATEIANEQIDFLFERWNEFCTSIKDLNIITLIYKQLEDFTNMLQSVDDFINDDFNIDTRNMPKHEVERIMELIAKKSELLADIYNSYHNKHDEEEE